MDALLFTLVDGGGIAIDADEISAFWSGKTPGTTVIERMGHEHPVVVLGEYDKIASDLYGSTDMRPRKAKKRAAPKAKKRSALKLVVKLDEYRRKRS
jgi:hypothetical protein